MYNRKARTVRIPQGANDTQLATFTFSDEQKQVLSPSLFVNLEI